MAKKNAMRNLWVRPLWHIERLRILACEQDTLVLAAIVIPSVRDQHSSDLPVVCYIHWPLRKLLLANAEKRRKPSLPIVEAPLTMALGTAIQFDLRKATILPWAEVKVDC